MKESLNLTVIAVLYESKTNSHTKNDGDDNNKFINKEK